MAENEQVSREAFERVKNENAQFKEQLAQATAALTDVSIRDKAYSVFANKPGVKDPYALASSALPHLRGVEEDKFSEAADKFIEQQQRMWGVDPAQPPSDDDGDGTPPTPPPPTPGLVPSPSPGHEGSPPQPKVHRWDDPEIVELRNKGRNDVLSKMVDEGSLMLSPGNPYATTPSTGT